MQLIGVILAAALVLAALQAALGFILIVFAGALLFSAIWRPAQTFGTLLFVSYVYLLGQHGKITLLVTAGLMLVGFLAKRREDRSKD